MAAPTLVSVDLTEPTPNPDPRHPGRKTLVVGAVLLALAAGLVAVDITAGHQQPRTPAAAAPPAAVPGAPLAPAAPPAPAPRPQPLDLTVPVTTPAGLTWSTWAGEQEPTSTDAGPAHVTGAVAAGYARSPLGALLAAQQIGTRYLISPHGGWRAVTLAQVVPGPGRDHFIALRAATTDNPPAAGLAQPVAFRYVTWTPAQGVVQLVSRVPGRDGFQVVTATVLWRDGDWRLQLQNDGGVSPTAVTVPTPTGFVLWGAPSA